MRTAKKGVRFIPRTKEVINILKKYWIRFKDADAEFRHNLCKIESEMQKELKEPLLEFFYVDNECAGIGTPADPKKMKLVRTEQLESN